MDVQQSQKLTLKIAVSYQGLATEFGLGPGDNEIEENTGIISEIGKK